MMVDPCKRICVVFGLVATLSSAPLRGQTNSGLDKKGDVAKPLYLHWFKPRYQGNDGSPLHLVTLRVSASVDFEVRLRDPAFKTRMCRIKGRIDQRDGEFVGEVECTWKNGTGFEGKFNIDKPRTGRPLGFASAYSPTQVVLSHRRSMNPFLNEAAIEEPPETNPRSAAFTRLSAGRPSADWRLTVNASGHYEYFRYDPFSGRTSFTHDSGQFSEGDLARLDELLSETNYLNRTVDEIANAYRGYLSVEYRSRSFAVNLNRRADDTRYEKLMEFLDEFSAKTEKTMPKIPWQTYTTRLYDDAVANDQLVLQYYLDPISAHEIHNRAGPASADTIAFIEKHDVVCLNASPKSWNGIPGERPHVLIDGLSIYSPKTGRTIRVEQLDAPSLLASMRRAISDPEGVPQERHRPSR